MGKEVFRIAQTVLKFFGSGVYKREDIPALVRTQIPKRHLATEHGEQAVRNESSVTVSVRIALE
jgi:hypothetical protein